MFPEPGTIAAERRDGVAVLRLIGDHDLLNVSALETELAAHAEDGTGVVVSLMETQFIDSSVVNALFRADRQLADQGRRLVLHVATESIVRRVLEITRLATYLPTSGSLEEALALAARDETG